MNQKNKRLSWPSGKLVAAAMWVSMMVVPAESRAAEMQVIADTPLGQISMDPATVAQAAPYTQAWFTYDFKKTQRLVGPETLVFMQRKDHVLVQCAEHRFGIGQSDFLDGDRMVFSKTIAPAEIKFIDITPDTMAAKLYDALCKAGTPQ